MEQYTMTANTIDALTAANLMAAPEDKTSDAAETTALNSIWREYRVEIVADEWLDGSGYSTRGSIVDSFEACADVPSKLIPNDKDLGCWVETIWAGDFPLNTAADWRVAYAHGHDVEWTISVYCLDVIGDVIDDEHPDATVSVWESEIAKAILADCGVDVDAE